jgi:hypothetical protein
MHVCATRVRSLKGGSKFERRSEVSNSENCFIVAADSIFDDTAFCRYISLAVNRISQSNNNIK